jgi:hypothetical protein
METAVNLTNQAVTMSYPGAHHLDNLANTLPLPDAPTPTPIPANGWTTSHGLAPQPLGSFDGFVNNAIGLAQGGALCPQCLWPILFLAINMVSQPLDPTNSPWRQDPISQEAQAG